MVVKLMFSIAIISSLSILSGCYDMKMLKVKPSTTTVTYGQDRSTGEKDAKNGAKLEVIHVLLDKKTLLHNAD